MVRSRRPSEKPSSPPSPRVDGLPRRPWSSVNVRQEEKRKFDVLHQWWSRRHGHPLSQWDAFSILLHSYLGREDVPPAVRSMLEEVA